VSATDAVLVDTTIWVDAFRGRDRALVDQLRALLVEDRVRICGPILCEFRRGLRPPERTRVLANLAAVRRLDFTEDDWDAAGDLDAALRSRGVTIAPFDVLIARVALREGVPLWTRDPHFAAVEGVRLHQP